MNVLRACALSFAVALGATAARAQAAPEAAQAATPPISHGPLTIDQAVQMALERDPFLLAQQLQARSAADDVRTALSNILPNLNFNASYSRVRIGGGEILGELTILNGVSITEVNPTQLYPAYAAGLSVRQLIFDGGKWWNNLATFDNALAVQRQQTEEQRLQTVFAARQKFYELVRAQQTLRVLKESARRSHDQADSTQRLYEGGRTTQADVYAGRANRDNDIINVLSQESQVEQARQDLAIALGFPVEEALTIIDPPDLSEDPKEPPTLSESIDKALSRRPSLKAFNAAITQMHKAVAAAGGDYWPVVSFLGQYQRSTRSLDDFTRSLDQANTLSGTINLTWNVFTGFATDANVDRAQIQVQLAEVNLVRGKRGVASDVERAVASWASARTRASVAKQVEENSLLNHKLARRRQEVGVGTQLEVRDAELKVTQAQLSRVSALIDGHEAVAAYRRATGEM